MSRFLLPVFPVALSCTVAAIELSKTKLWRLTHFVVLASLAALCAIGIGGLAIFSRAPLLASLGFYNPTAYLNATVQDFSLAHTINQVIRAQPQPSKTLVFFRHLYYLEVPFINGNPDDSWSINPELLKTPEQWNRFFVEQGICYVVRSPNYPRAIAAPLLEMEQRGDLIPIATTEVENFRGMRMSEDRTSVAVVFLKVK
jgi:hypothetical protein